jgi:hypothetical protein
VRTFPLAAIGRDGYERVEAIAGVLLLGIFVAYFGLVGFGSAWSGDIERHCASVASLYRSFVRPPHEAMAAPGSASEVHTPYIVAVAGVGRLVAVTPYRALQIAGVANLCLYALAVCVFFRTLSVAPRSFIPPVAFLAISLFMRERRFHWASETSFAAVRQIQAYPSFFGWGVALVLFVLVERYLRSPRGALLVVIGGLLGVLLLSHSLTAVWVVEMIGLRGLWELIRRGRAQALRPVALLGIAVIAGVAATVLWPYFDITQSPALRVYPEGSEFGDHPFRDMARMYVVAAVAAAWFLWHGRHRLLVGGFLATFAALELWRALDYSYGNRFAFFQAFFAQALVADVVAVGLLLAFRQERRLSLSVTPGRATRLALPALAAATMILCVTAPIIAAEREVGRRLVGFPTLLARHSAHDAYYRSLDSLQPWLTRDDIVLMPLERRAFDIASIIGARVVVSPFAYRVPDYRQRVEDVAQFLSPGAPPATRRRIIETYSVSKVLLSAPYLGLTAELSPYGVVHLANGTSAVIDVTPGRAAGPPDPSGAL